MSSMWHIKMHDIAISLMITSQEIEFGFLMQMRSGHLFNPTNCHVTHLAAASLGSESIASNILLWLIRPELSERELKHFD
jgi:hypothetical protein